MPETPESNAEHEIHKSDDSRKFWLTCGGTQFARLLLDDPTLSAPEFGIVQAFAEKAIGAHMSVEHFTSNTQVKED